MLTLRFRRDGGSIEHFVQAINGQEHRVVLGLTMTQTCDDWRSPYVKPHFAVIMQNNTNTVGVTPW